MIVWSVSCVCVGAWWLTFDRQGNCQVSWLVVYESASRCRGGTQTCLKPCGGEHLTTSRSSRPLVREAVPDQTHAVPVVPLHKITGLFPARFCVRQLGLNHCQHPVGFNAHLLGRRRELSARRVPVRCRDAR